VASRPHQAILIGSTLLGSWLGMQAVHEAGHVAGAWLTGGKVAKVVLHPLTFSRTDLARNPRPLIVVWAGPIVGSLAPLLIWGIATARMRGAFVLRFFAGFCLVANGAYIAGGSLFSIGDCGEMLRHGSPHWLLWLFGLVTVPIGLLLWHRQGSSFGFGKAEGQVDLWVGYGTLAACLVLLAIGFVVGR
jgi:hypothetical protein